MSTEINLERQLQLANIRLNDRTAAISQRLSTRLDDVRQQHELTLASLLSEQQAAHKTNKEGQALTATAYWQKVAEPKASLYVADAVAVLDDEIDAIEDAVRRFLESIRIFAKASGRRADPRAVSGWIAEAVQPLLDSTPAMDNLNRVGDRWQKRLRRTAAMHSIPDLLLNPRLSAGDIVSQTEMRLLENSPWVHGDRMLSAFELATSDIRAHLASTLAKVATSHTAEAKRQEAQDVLVLR